MGRIFNALQKSGREKHLRPEKTPVTPGENPVPTETPSTLPAPRLLMIEDPSSPAAEQFRIARNIIRAQEKDQVIRSILVTAVVAGTVTHHVSSNLAATFAAEPGGNVLLIDADLRAAGVTDLFQALELPGITNLLTDFPKGELTVDKVLAYCLPTSVEGLAVLPSGGRADLPPDVFIRSPLTEIPSLLAEQYRTLVFEGPAVLETMDIAVFASLVDAVILVIEAGRTSRDELIRAVELVQGSGANLAGCIVSGAVQTIPRWVKRILMVGPRS